MDKILQALSNNGFATIDYLVFIAYIIILVSLGIFLSRGKKGEEKSSTDYFLAGNTLTWWAVGASLIAANISAEQFIGISGIDGKLPSRKSSAGCPSAGRAASGNSCCPSPYRTRPPATSPAGASSPAIGQILASAGWRAQAPGQTPAQSR